jgi:hypothetical protein
MPLCSTAIVNESRACRQRLSGRLRWRFGRRPPVELTTERLLIEPNHVFIIPERRDLHVLDREFRPKPISKPRAGDYGFPAIPDKALGRKLIAFIVSGYDGDGAAALCCIKDVGGQRRLTAWFGRIIDDDLNPFPASFSAVARPILRPELVTRATFALR